METEKEAAWSPGQTYTVKLDQGVMDKMLLLALSALLPWQELCVLVWSHNLRPY